ncbi:hypothetical protein EXIGLDRAFT_728133 [Exidia glandulosa HHB12029]|uniref:F-box domain-containing protein n=1 Tax=Exidia glandulosa HHB12029 TaxID=1314781 RepID=A0A165LVW1_EXIGL|nr:hypothetical protein EXIGLDRAFT_728133 [Exidia glandulosa HHB12029]
MTGGACGEASMPPEILAIILGLLPQPTLLQAAQVCRRWRAVAMEQDNFYRFVRLDLSGNASTRLLAQTIRSFDRFISAAEFACATLSLEILADVQTFTRAGSRHDIARDIIPVLRRAVPILVKLVLCLETTNMDDVRDPLDLVDAFDIRAPRLRELDFLVVGEHVDAGEDIEIGLQTLFAGSAPSLSSVSLSGLATRWIPPDSSVRTLTIVWASPEDITTALNMCPHVVSLHLESIHSASSAIQLTFPTTLQHISVGDQYRLPSTDIMPLFDHCSVQCIEFFSEGDGNRFLSAFALEGALALDIWEYPIVEDRNETRYYPFEGSDRSRVRLTLTSDCGQTRCIDCGGRDDIKNVLRWCAERVHKIRADDRLLHSLAGCSTAFPFLDILEVDLTSWASAPDDEDSPVSSGSSSSSSETSSSDDIGDASVESDDGSGEDSSGSVLSDDSVSEDEVITSMFDQSYSLESSSPVRCPLLATVVLRSTRANSSVLQRTVEEILHCFQSSASRTVVLTNGLTLDEDADVDFLDSIGIIVRVDASTFSSDEPAVSRAEAMRTASDDFKRFYRSRSGLYTAHTLFAQKRVYLD